MNVIHFTDKAIEAIQKYRAALQVTDEQFVRIGIRQKNETNKRLLIGFDAKTDRDQEIDIAGMKVIYSPGEVFFFAGMAIDYVDDNGRKGFTFVEHKKTQA